MCFSPHEALCNDHQWNKNDFHDAIVTCHQNQLESLLLDGKYFGAGATVPECKFRPPGVCSVLGASPSTGLGSVRWDRVRRSRRCLVDYGNFALAKPSCLMEPSRLYGDYSRA
jgi:hypothetical protein